MTGPALHGLGYKAQNFQGLPTRPSRSRGTSSQYTSPQCVLQVSSIEAKLWVSVFASLPLRSTHEVRCMDTFVPS